MKMDKSCFQYTTGEILCKQLFDHLTQTYVRATIILKINEHMFVKRGMSMNTTELRNGDVRLGTVKYVRLRKRWRWNPRKGITHLVFLVFYSVLC